MTRAISLAFLLLVGCGPSHLISLRTELPPVTDAQTRARLALGHRDDLTGAPAADLDRLRRLAELEVALGQRKEAILTWGLAMELSRADVATARGAELERARTRLEETRAWVIEGARQAGADRTVLDALWDVRDLAPWADVIAGLGRLERVRRLPAETSDALAAVLPPRVWATLTDDAALPEALEPSLHEMASIGPVARDHLERRLDRARRRERVEVALEVARSLQTFEHRHVPAWLMTRLAATPGTRAVVSHVPVTVATLRDMAALELARRERPHDPIVALASAWGAILFQQGPDARRMAARARRDAADEETRAMADLIVALADLQADDAGALTALVDADWLPAPLLNAIIDGFDAGSSESPATRGAIARLARREVERLGADATWTVAYAVAIDADAPRGLRLTALQSLARSNRSYAVAASSCVLRALDDETCEARMRLEDDFLDGTWPEAEEGRDTLALLGSRSGVHANLLYAALEVSDAERADLRRWLAELEGTEVALRADWVSVSISLALLGGDRAAAEALFAQRGALLPRPGAAALEAELARDDGGPPGSAWIAEPLLRIPLERDEEPAAPLEGPAVSRLRTAASRLYWGRAVPPESLASALPELPPAARSLGCVVFVEVVDRRGDSARLRHWTRALQESAPGSAEAAYFAGRVVAADGRTEEALAAYRTAALRQPRADRLRQRVGLARLEIEGDARPADAAAWVGWSTRRERLTRQLLEANAAPDARTLHEHIVAGERVSAETPLAVARLLTAAQQREWRSALIDRVAESTDAALAVRRAREASERLAQLEDDPDDPHDLGRVAMLRWLADDIEAARAFVRDHPDDLVARYLEELLDAREPLGNALAWEVFRDWWDPDADVSGLRAWLDARAPADPRLDPVTCTMHAGAGDAEAALAPCLRAHRRPGAPGTMAVRLGWAIRADPNGAAARGVNEDRVFARLARTSESVPESGLHQNIADWHTIRGRHDEAAVWRLRALAAGSDDWRVETWEVGQAPYRGVSLRTQVDTRGTSVETATHRAVFALAEGDVTLAEDYMTLAFAFVNEAHEGGEDLSRAYLMRDLVAWAREDVDADEIGTDGLNAFVRARMLDYPAAVVVPLVRAHSESRLVTYAGAMHAMQNGVGPDTVQALHALAERSPRPTALLVAMPMWVIVLGEAEVDAQLASMRETFPDDPRLEAATLLPEVPLPDWAADPVLATRELAAVDEALSVARFDAPTRGVSLTSGAEVWIPPGFEATGETAASYRNVRATVSADPRHSDCDAATCVDQIAPQITRAGFQHRWTAPVTIPVGEGRRALFTRGPRALLLTIVPVGTRVYTISVGGTVRQLASLLMVVRSYEQTFRPVDVVVGAAWSERLRGEVTTPWPAMWAARLALEASEGEACPITESLTTLEAPADRGALVRALYLTTLDTSARRRLIACVDPQEGVHGGLGLAAALDPDPRIHDFGIAAVRADADRAAALVTSLSELPPGRAASGLGRYETSLPGFGLAELLGALPQAQRYAVTDALTRHADPRLRALAFASNYAVGDTLPRARLREAVVSGTAEDATLALHSSWNVLDAEDHEIMRTRFDAIIDYSDDADRRLAQTLSYRLARYLDAADLPRLERAFAATEGSEDPSIRLLHNRLDWDLAILRHALGRERSENERVQRFAEGYRLTREVLRRDRLSSAVVRRLATTPLPEVLPGGHWTYTRVPQPALFLATLQQLHSRLQSGSAMDTAIARRSIAMMVEHLGGELLGPDGGLDLGRPVECARSDRFPPAWVCAAYVADRDRVRDVLARRPLGTNSGVALQLEVSQLAASLPSIAGALPTALDSMLHPPPPEEPSQAWGGGRVLDQERSRSVVRLGGVTFDRFATFQVREGGDASIDTEHYLFTGDRVLFFGLETTARAILARPLPRGRTLAGDRTFQRLTRGWSEGAALQMANVNVEVEAQVPMPWSQVSLEMVADGAGITTEITLPLEEEDLADVSGLAARLPPGAVARIGLALGSQTNGALGSPGLDPEEPRRPPYHLLSRAEGFAFGWYPSGGGVWDRWVSAVRAGEAMEEAFAEGEIPYPSDGAVVSHGQLRYARRGDLIVVGTHEADVVATRDADPGATEARVGLGSLDGARGAAILMGIAGGLSADDPRRQSIGMMGAMVGLGRELSFEATVEGETMHVVTRALPNLASESDDRLVIDHALGSTRNAITLPRRIRDAESDGALTFVLEVSDPELVAARLFGNRRRVRARVVGERRLEVTVATVADAGVLPATERERLLRADPMLRLDAPEIVGAASALAPADASAADVAAAVSSWVHAHLRYELTSENLDASTILARERGDCTEHARLAVALLRRRGIPAEVREGFTSAAGELVAHAWVTYHDGERFREIDPTGGVDRVGGDHVPMSVTDAMALIAMGDLRVVEVRAAR
ncbi:MAG: transglutaminase-like domain-containing protein [Sandaracinaceae bacterium]